MSNFNEAKHLRANDGKFSTKDHPEANLDAINLTCGQWEDYGISPTVAESFAARGYTAGEAADFMACGLNAETARQWSDLGKTGIDAVESLTGKPSDGSAPF